jgi:hypothetical protein
MLLASGGAVCGFILLNLALLSDHHTIRVALRRIIEVDSPKMFTLPPSDLASGFRYEDRALLNDFFFPVPFAIRST